ncbi:hypothetical protein AVEN_74690-1 [Araneus ventricosus]|uniref:Uncharacterized protein n=1 Tax=Araneus ventricosus TaxID=182803 RepID=A0A4Y2KGT8_ARAVE|nr:hypothetical protein AVEN_74690-1 [Araneus ventricosus]
MTLTNNISCAHQEMTRFSFQALPLIRSTSGHTSSSSSNLNSLLRHYLHPLLPVQRCKKSKQLIKRYMLEDSKNALTFISGPFESAEQHPVSTKP